MTDLLARRSFLRGLVAAPAVLKLGLWMPVRAIVRSPFSIGETVLITSLGIEYEVSAEYLTIVSINYADGYISFDDGSKVYLL